ncbi:MAG: DUF2183 domain-containing protein, partial [Chitinophagaceae bacterium]|nr:DUF2183 domain-containing protein [Anaerolineae bacterium]
YDELKFGLRQRLKHAPLMILPYIGHGTPDTLHLHGRVMEDKHIGSAKDDDTIWDNLANMYRRLTSREIPYAVIKAQFAGIEVEVTADSEGFFEVQIPVNSPELSAFLTTQVTHEISLKLIDYPQRHHPLEDVTAIGEIIVPQMNTQFGIISDLDDTIIKTDVLEIIKLARNTFLRNARTRLPFEGVAAFYRALQLGTIGGYNPIFYVSNSPWNLYDLIVDFFEVRDIPIGTFFLKDLGLTENHFIADNSQEHKTGLIQTLLDQHPQLSFILIGDSGEHDPEIYYQIAQANPSRVKAIYIRDVTPKAARDQQIMTLIEKSKLLGIDMLLVPDTIGAAEHAALNGFILKDSLMTIRVERAEDQKPPEPLEKLIDPKATAEDVGGEEAP